jgi:osmotically-inducible protein OsmY
MPRGRGITTMALSIRQRKELAMSNDQLVASVTDELRLDPMVDPEAIAVGANDGTVSLRGTVGTFGQKRAAKRAAERVRGVRSVDNKLKVRLLTGSGRDDADMRADVLRALMLDSLVPSTVDATVTDGYVTLSGKADWQYQRDEAEFVAGNVAGVLDVWNDIVIASTLPDANGVKQAIDSALERRARLDADDVKVRSAGGTVTLEGKVGSWAEHDEALAAAWAAPGVRDVDDRLRVEYF